MPLSSDAKIVFARPDFWARLANRLITAWNWLEHGREKARSRIILSELTDSQLEDIGVTRAEARRESCRPFWN